MNKVANTQKKDGGQTAQELPALTWTEDAELVSMAFQLRTFAQNAAMNLLQMGRILNEAKDRVPHGEWAEYVKSNAKMSLRTAQTYMQAYNEFGLNPQIAELGSSQIIRLLPMTMEEREKLLTEHDVGNMSVRDMDREIKRIREEEQQKAREAVEAERNSGLIQLAREREAAEKRIREAEAREPEIREVQVIPKELTEELEQARAEIDRMAETNRELMDGSRGWMGEKSNLENQVARLKRELAESEDMIREQQEAMNEAQEELLNMKSAAARGEEKAYSDELTPDILIAAAREFIGICARGPHMHGAYARMEAGERQKVMEIVGMMREWVKGMETALDTLTGGVIVE